MIVKIRASATSIMEKAWCYVISCRVLNHIWNHYQNHQAKKPHRIITTRNTTVVTDRYHHHIILCYRLYLCALNIAHRRRVRRQLYVTSYETTITIHCIICSDITPMKVYKARPACMYVAVYNSGYTLVPMKSVRWIIRPVLVRRMRVSVGQQMLICHRHHHHRHTAIRQLNNGCTRQIYRYSLITLFLDRLP